MLKVIYEERVPVVAFVGEPDEAMFSEFKAHGIKIVYRSLNPTPKNARETEKFGADIIVATGFDEGGTLPSAVLGTFSIVPLIVDAVDHTPVMAPNVKQAVLSSDALDLLLFRTIPAYYRSLPGALANELVAMDKAGASNDEPGRKMGGFTNLRIGMLEGDMNKGYVSVGNGISFIHEILSVQQIMDNLTKDF